MIWVLVTLAIAFVVLVFCPCRVSGQQDESAGELERALRENGRSDERQD